MSNKIEKRIDEYPTANEMMLIEQILDNWYDSAIKIKELIKKTPSEITEDKLKQILYYFEKTNKKKLKKTQKHKK